MILNGTTYKASFALAEVIERCRQSKKHFRFHLGDSVTGRAWGDVDEGYIGRSMGPIKIPPRDRKPAQPGRAGPARSLRREDRVRQQERRRRSLPAPGLHARSSMKKEKQR